MSGLNVGGASLSLACKCGAKVGFTLEQVARGATLVCPNCGINIHLQDNNGSAKRAIADTDRAFRGLQRSIDNLNRRLRH